MREMKDSGLKWIGQIPNGWEVNRIKYLFKTAKGLSVTKNNLIEDGLPVISYGQIHSKINTGVTVADELRRFVSYDYRKYVSSKLEKFDFAFADTSEDYEGCGNCVYKRTDDELYGGYHVVILHSIKKEDNRYFAYLFQTDAWREQIRTKASGVKVFSVTQKIINEASVIIPPIEMQARISNFLDVKCAEIDALTADIQTQIDILEQYKRSVITEAVTKGLNPDAEMKDSGIDGAGMIPSHWKTTRLCYECYIRARLGWRGLKADEYVDDGYAFISAFNIQNGKLVWAPLNYITKERFDESPEIKLHKGDVLIVKDGAGVGKCARVDDLPIGGTAPNSSIAVITPNESQDYRYVCYYLQSAVFNNFVLLLYNGMGVPHLTQEVMSKIKILVPPLKEQMEISDYLDAKCTEIDAIVEAKKTQHATLDDYKKSLIYEYVTGKKEVPENA